MSDHYVFNIDIEVIDIAIQAVSQYPELDSPVGRLSLLNCLMLDLCLDFTILSSTATFVL